MDLSLFGAGASKGSRPGLHTSRAYGCYWSLNVDDTASRKHAYIKRPHRLAGNHSSREERVLDSVQICSRR